LGVFENRVLRRIFLEEEVVRSWKRLHKEELHNLYALPVPNIIIVIKSRRMRWAGNITCMGQTRNAYKIFVRKPEERDHLKDIDIGRKILFERILGR